MAIVVKDRVQETSTTTGTGTLTLGGAVSGFQTFSSAIGNGNYTYYSIVNGAEWEVGYGLVTAGQLSRDNVWESSNSGALVNFSAGTKNVFCTYPAEKAVIQDQNGKVGIGTNTPTYQLEVYGSEPTSRIYIDNTGYAGMLQIANPSNSMLIGKDRDGSSGWYGNAGQYIIACNGAFPLDFYTNGTKRMSLTSAGGVSFGTSGTAYGTSGQVLKSNGNAAPTWGDAGASFNYSVAGTPAYNTNPSTANVSWLNTTTGEIWMCTSNATNSNVWKLIGYTSTISASTVFDIFGDSSAVALYQFTSGNGTDTGGSYSMTTNTFSSGTGIAGTCASGSGSYMKNGNSMNNNKVVSVSAWVNVSDTGNNWVWSSGKQSNGTCKRGLRISSLGIDAGTYCQEYNAGASTTGAGSITSGTWTNITISKDKIYKDGVLVFTMSSYTAPSSDTYGFYIGANGAYDYGYITSETYGQPMNGLIDQIRVFNRELTSTEVAQLYAEGGV